MTLTMIVRVGLILTLFIFSVEPVLAFQWPWEHHRTTRHYVHHRRHRLVVPTPDDSAPVAKPSGGTTPFAEPKTDCTQVREARRRLGDAQWQYDYDNDTVGQRANIDKCLGVVPP